MAPNELYRLMRLVEREIDQEKEAVDGELHVLHDHLLYEFTFAKESDNKRWFPTQKES